MVDPFNITQYNRTDDELEEFFIFCRLVAGKHSIFAAGKTYRLALSPAALDLQVWSEYASREVEVNV